MMSAKPKYKRKEKAHVAERQDSEKCGDSDCHTASENPCASSNTSPNNEDILIEELKPIEHCSSIVEYLDVEANMEKTREEFCSKPAQNDDVDLDMQLSLDQNYVKRSSLCESLDKKNDVFTRVLSKYNTNNENSKIQSDVTVEQNTSTDYSDLLKELETSIDNIIQPSAPDFSLEEEGIWQAQGNFASFLPQCQERKEEKCMKNTEAILKLSIGCDVDIIEPLSEQELSQFYINNELKQALEFTHNFTEEELNNETKILHPFYNLLLNYLRAKISLQSSKHKIKELDEKVHKYVSEIWTVWNDIEIFEIGKCLDGNSLKLTQKYTQAEFSHEVFENFKSALLEIRTNLFQTFKVDSFNCLRYKLKTEQYIQSLITSCPEFNSLTESSTISLVQPSTDSYFQQCLSNLKISIGILFLFQRKQKLDLNSSFLEESRQWLTDLVSILIRVGNWKDHLFLLNHILRCPGGVGMWASSYIQFPIPSNLPDPFSDPVIHHIMAVMSVLLQPVLKREDFMNEWNLPGSGDENSWVMVDSDDEDGETLLSNPLKENDLVLLLNQIPLKNLFSSVLGLTNGQLDPHIITVNHLMKLFSFSSDIIKIIQSGLQLYSTQRYKQFAKRLGRLIRHIMEYTTYEFDIFRSNDRVTNHESLKRLQVEYDQFFIKSTKSIFSSRIHGTWQFLAVVPYHLASRSMILKLYSILQLSDTENKSITEINLPEFEENFEKLPESEQFYLLSTFTSMALARDLLDVDFIKVVVHQLLYIGFISALTKEKCYKNVKSLLFNLCTSHPFLLSDILRIQHENFVCNKNCDQSLSVHLWKELPVRIWKVDTDDLEILSLWLLQPVQSIQNELARLILKTMNYDFEQGELFLPLETHKKIAFMIMNSNIKVPQNQEMNVIKNVSTLVGFQEPGPFHVWGWNLLLKLHLHLLDQSTASVQCSFANINENLCNIPALDCMKELSELVLQKHPMACYIALMTTTMGHSVPVIFNKGFELVEILIRAKKYEAAVVCIEYLTLMFLECTDSLYKCEYFISILSHLINSDHSYLKLAKNFKGFETPGPVSQLLENMIQNQLHYCDEIGLNSSKVLELWIKTLTKLPLWIQDPGVVHLLDILCKHAYFNRSASSLVKDFFIKLLSESSSSPTESRSSLATLVNWMNNKYTIPTLLPRGYNPNAVWYFLKVIEIEQDIFETNNCLWNELLKEILAASNKKTNIDSCLKKCCNNLQIPVRTSEVLIIYRLCYQILETKITHPMIIILWQKFFLLYFCRVPDFRDSGSLGDKFFDGIVNQNLLKRLRLRLKETSDCFSELYKKSYEVDKNVTRGEYYSKCFQVLNMFHLWFEEQKLHEPHLSLHLLPPQYNSDLFGTIMNGNNTPWTDVLDYYQVQNENEKSILRWQEIKGRRNNKEFFKSPNANEEKCLIVRIQDELARYENPMSPPSLNLRKYTSKSLIREVLVDTDSMDSFLKPSFRTVIDYADYYVKEIGEYIGLSCDLQDLVKQLYSIKRSCVTLKQTCDGFEKVINGKKISFRCSGPAIVTLSYEESEMERKNYDLFNKSLRDYKRCLLLSLMPPQLKLGNSILTLENAVEELKSEYIFMRNHSEDKKLISSIKLTGINLFYHFIETWSESISYTPAIMTIFKNCLDVLGNTFIIENPSECDTVLNKIVEHSILVDHLHKYFTPNICSSQNFIDLYSKAKTCRPDIRIVVLSRFDMLSWLNKIRPRFSERSLLISEIGSGLKCFGPSTSDKVELIKIYNSHLKHILMYDFPEHYGEVLNLLLEGSESHTIPVSTWFMFLNSIVSEGIHFLEGKYDGSSFEEGQTAKELKIYFTQNATHQKLLSLADIRETIIHLANFFKTDRLKHCLYGLYPKYRYYVEPIYIFCGMMSHCYVAETLKLDLGSLSMRIADQLWPLIRDLYSPWLVPYWSKQEKAQSAKWIQELTDDKCVLLPWINADISLASHCCTVFMESVRFVLDTLPGVNSILSHIWFFYVTNFAHIQVKDHILRIIHKNLLQLPWQTFSPSLQDIELMVKVVEHFIPMAHSLLGSIFVKIKWTDLVNQHLKQNDLEILTKLHICLLHLLVKLPCEPSLKQCKEMVILLTEAKEYKWHLVDASSYDTVLNWFVMSCDPRIILMDEKSDYYMLDSLILEILRNCAGYSKTTGEFHSTTLKKRLMYTRANNKWLTTANSRFKCKHSPVFKSAIFRILNELETTIVLSVTDNQKSEELAIVLSEFLNIFKEEELTSIVEEVMIKWLSTKRDATLIYGLLRSIAHSPVSPATFGNIAETCLTSYFDSSENATWPEINSKFVMYASGQSGLHKALINNDNLLTLNAILMKQQNDHLNLLENKIILSDIFQSLTSAKRSETVEPKLVLMILQAFSVAQIVMRLDESEGISILSRLSTHLICVFNDKGNTILSTFGLKKNECFSNRFRFICLIASSGIMILFKTHYIEYEDKIDEKILRSLEQVTTNKQYHNMGPYVKITTDEIKTVKSVEEIVIILRRLGMQFYNKNFLK